MPMIEQIVLWDIWMVFIQMMYILHIVDHFQMDNMK